MSIMSIVNMNLNDLWSLDVTSEILPGPIKCKQVTVRLAGLGLNSTEETNVFVNVIEEAKRYYSQQREPVWVVGSWTRVPFSPRDEDFLKMRNATESEFNVLRDLAARARLALFMAISVISTVHYERGYKCDVLYRRF